MITQRNTDKRRELQQGAYAMGGITPNKMFNTLRTDVTFKKSFAQLREQAFRLATEADPKWESPRAMRILAIYQKIGRKYIW